MRKPNTIKGPQLRVAVSIGSRYSAEIGRQVRAMIEDANSQILSLFENGDYDGDYGMDGNIGSQARITLNSLIEKWEKVFAQMASRVTTKMQDQVLANSTSAIQQTLKGFAGENLTLNPGAISAQMREMLTASAAESTGLIKSIPSKYLEDLGGSVMRSIVSGKGMADLQPQLAIHAVSIKNWAKNTALDQTRKVYTHTNIARLKKAKIRKFEWVHSGGGAHPRKLHQEMNGKIYDMDNPPFIGVMYGRDVYGFPSDLPNCRCVLRPVLDFGGEDADS